MRAISARLFLGFTGLARLAEARPPGWLGSWLGLLAKPGWQKLGWLGKAGRANWPGQVAEAGLAWQGWPTGQDANIVEGC